MECSSNICIELYIRQVWKVNDDKKNKGESKVYYRIISINIFY